MNLISRPDPDLPVRSGSRPHEGAQTEPAIPCPLSLALTEEQVYTLVARCGMPEWAIEPCLQDFLLGATAGSEVRPLDVWRRWAAKHVWSMWQTPGRRPLKPEATLDPADASALRRARRAALRSERERSEEAWRRFTAGSCLPTPEQASQFAKIGIKIPSRSKEPRGATGLSPTEREGSNAGVRTSEAHSASEGLLGGSKGAE